ncbi:MAG: hypothetical protein HKO68_01950 [Desulfobacterales bacterium]|nr:hypothetical protein [Desulfobacterales bacterium]NNL75080.1 hypothetical protein [Desulfobacterales bacterium]
MSKESKIEIEKLRITASTLIEDGQSVCEITEHLIREKGANRVVAENVVKEFYKDRQKHYRMRGLFFLSIAGVVLIGSLVLQEMTNELMSEWNKWAADGAIYMVVAVKLVLWGVAFYFSLKGLLYLLFGGRGVRIRRPT